LRPLRPDRQRRLTPVDVSGHTAFTPEGRPNAHRLCRWGGYGVQAGHGFDCRGDRAAARGAGAARRGSRRRRSHGL